MAFLVDEADSITNQFEPTEVTCAVEETLTETAKTNVKVKNTGDIDAYMRAAVVITWQNANGDVYGVEPVEGSDYAIEFDLSNGWTQGSDGFYYWASPVKSVNEGAENCFTGALIKSCSLKDGANAPKDGFHLSVEVIASSIQAEPTSAVVDAWDVTVADDGKSISKPLASSAPEGEGDQNE